MEFSVIVLAAILHVTLGQSNYCQISPAHTMCKFQGPGPQCRAVLARGLSPEEEQEIVDTHNRLRAKVATGQEPLGRPGPQGPAADMMELVWDEEVASIAQRWADQCNFGHDQNRDVSRFKVGQNVFEASDPNPGPVNYQQAISGWYDEVKDVDARQSDVFGFSSGTGHFTQMVWASTRTIGCGSVSYQNGGFINKYVVCNYGPSGNFIGNSMYKRGSACSACPAGTSCSTQNPGLCKSDSLASIAAPVNQPSSVQPAQPVFITRPAQPAQPVFIAQPAQPAQPVFIAQPAQPAQTVSVQPTLPVQPVLVQPAQEPSIFTLPAQQPNQGFQPIDQGFQPIDQGFQPINQGSNQGFQPINQGFQPVNQGSNQGFQSFPITNQGFGQPSQGFGQPSQGFGQPSQGFGQPNQDFQVANNQIPLLGNFQQIPSGLPNNFNGPIPQSGNFFVLNRPVQGSQRRPTFGNMFQGFANIFG